MTHAAVAPTQAQIDQAFPLDAVGLHTTHRARKAGPCQYGRLVDGGQRCNRTIFTGDLYVAGHCDFHAGPWARTRWCMECVAFEVQRSQTESP